MKKRGIAIGNFRADSIKWDALEVLSKPNAPKARERMAEGPKSLTEAVAEQQKRLENQGSLTDQVVNDFMGGSRAAEYQANAYQGIIDGIKAGKTTAEAMEPAGSLAGAARKRMIEREQKQSRDNDDYPDIGMDRANRRAYPKGSGTRKDAAENNAAVTHAEARASAIAWANAGSR